MKTIKHQYSETVYHSNITDQYFHPLQIGILDIETTGLNAQRDRVILGGLLRPKEKGLETIQYFAETLDDEKELLLRYTSDLMKYDVLISYNGNAFDLPFLKKRCEKYGLDFHYSPAQSFDLYRIIKNHSQLKKILPNLKQKTVETFLGLCSDRTDEISGAESVLYYEKYLRTHDAHLESFILLHNEDDLLQLSRLLQIIKKLDLHKIMFHNGFVLAQEEKQIFVEKIQLYKNRIKVLGTHRNISYDYRSYLESYEAHFSKLAGQFLLKIPVYLLEECVYVDLTEFQIDPSRLRNFSGYANDYLILQQKGIVNYCEINHLIQLLAKNILNHL